MPYKSSKIKLSRSQDRRIKLTDEQREEIRKKFRRFTMATNNSFSNRHFYYHSSDIAKCLQEICFDDSTNITIKDKDKYFDELENAIFNLHCIAANEHNLDCYRVLYETLVELTERADRNLLGNLTINIR